MSLFGCGAHLATRLREAENTGSLVSNGSNEATPREGRYGAGGTNGVPDLFLYTLHAVFHEMWSFGWVVKALFFSHVTARKKIEF